MASTWRQLAPHFLAMLVIYVLGIIAVWMAFDMEGFWVSLAIALAIAILYPSVVRAFGVAPEPWARDSDSDD